MRRYDQIIGLIWFALGSGMAIEGINLGLGNLNLPGTGFMSFLVGGTLGLCGLILTIWVSLKEKANEDKIWEGKNWKNLVFPILSLFVYAFLMEGLGFLITTFLFQFFLLKLTAPKRWLGPLLSSILIAICCYLIFSIGLKVTLPKGFFGI